jgi:hypothetical protein
MPPVVPPMEGVVRYLWESPILVPWFLRLRSRHSNFLFKNCLFSSTLTSTNDQVITTTHSKMTKKRVESLPAQSIHQHTVSAESYDRVHASTITLPARIRSAASFTEATVVATLEEQPIQQKPGLQNLTDELLLPIISWGTSQYNEPTYVTNDLQHTFTSDHRELSYCWKTNWCRPRDHIDNQYCNVRHPGPLRRPRSRYHLQYDNEVS